MPKISVVVPVYKVEKYLDECVESILAQTFSDFELILVDDGSPDNCPAMCDMWAQKDSRIRVIHKENSGASISRNIGILTAKGECISFVDSDDWVEPTFIQSMYEGLLSYDADIVQCKLKREGASRNVQYETNDELQIYDKERIREDLMINMAQDRGCLFGPSMCNKMYRMPIIKQSIQMCPEGQITGEDYLVNFAALGLCNRVVVLDTPPLYNYRVNPASITNMYNPLKRFQERRFWEAIYDIAVKAGIDELPNVDLRVQISNLDNIYACSVSDWSNKAKKEEIKALCTQISDKKLLLSTPKNEVRAKRIFLALVFLGLIDFMLLLVCVRKFVGKLLTLGMEI